MISAFLDEVAETILPATASSPGAKAAKVGDFMKTMVTDCYDEKEQKIFEDGLVKLHEASNKKYSKDFLDLDATQRHDLLVEWTKSERLPESKKQDDPTHYFPMIKQLTSVGILYFQDRCYPSTPVCGRSGPLRRLHSV